MASVLPCLLLAHGTIAAFRHDVPLSDSDLGRPWPKGWKAATAWPAFDFQPNRSANCRLADVYEARVEARSFRQRNRGNAIRDQILELGKVRAVEADPAEDPPVAGQGSPKQARGAAVLAIGASRHLDRAAHLAFLTDKFSVLQGIPIGPVFIGHQGLDRRGIDREIALDDGMTLHGARPKMIESPSAVAH